MKNLLPLLILALTLIAAPVRAEESKPDDNVMLTLSAENWVTTKSARVVLNVEAAISSGAAGTMRASMTKAVSDMIKAEWRVTSFDRSQDSTGLERWSAQYEARIPEADLNGLNEKAKQSSKAGMQITVAEVDFTPTLEETQAAFGLLRTQIYKMANEQLAALNGAIAGRGYRIASISFMGDGSPAPMPYAANRRSMAKTMMAGGAPEMDMASNAPGMERSDKINLSARIVYAATPAPQPAKAQ